MPALSLVGYHLTFDDEFSNPLLFKTSSDGQSGYDNQLYFGRTIWTNHEAENYVDPSAGVNPFSVANGVLTITAQPAAAGTNNNGLPYTSGLISTENSFSQNQGYFEMRAETPSTSGFWPAFWMLPDTNTGYPELDVLEQPNIEPNAYWSYANVGDSNKGGGFNSTGSDFTNTYHTYGLLWTATTVSFYFDGLQVGPSVAMPANFTTKMYLIANMAVGGQGSWPGQPQTGATAQFNIDYIRAYSNDPTVAAVAQKPISSPDGVNTTPSYIAPVAIAPAPVGLGPDVLTLNVSEDAYQGDARFTISVDGVQQGGPQVVTASHAAGQTETFTVLGYFAGLSHTVSVDFLNDQYDGNSAADRNLYINNAAYDGTLIPNSTLNEGNSGSQAFSFTAPGVAVTPTYAPVTIGSGVDQFSLKIAEDAYNGHAQFTISVDGQQQGGVQTAQASQALGASQIFNVDGTFGTKPHTVTVNFLNDAYGGSATADRNLYVDGLSYNGVESKADTAWLPSNGPVDMAVAGTAAYAGQTYAPVTIGTGPDIFSLAMAEDAYNGDAQFTNAVDGVQQGGVQSVQASQAQKATQTFNVNGTFGAGPHTVTVNFLNDAYGGSAAMDRNLYVDALSYNGAESKTDTAALQSGGPVNLGVAGTGVPVVPTYAPVTIGTGLDKFALGIAEDAYNGDAQFTIAVDGQQQGGIQTALASQALGAKQIFNVNGTFGAGSHTVTVNFLNDAYGNSAATDRNLYVDSLSYNGVESPNDTAALMTNGPANLQVTGTTVHDTLTFNLTEDAYAGDAKVELSMDGKVLGTQAVTFLNSGTTSQAITYTGDFGGAGVSHTAGVNFLNDAYGGSAATDRNVYVKSISFDGVAHPDQNAALLSGGLVNFNIAPATAPVVVMKTS